MLRRVLSIVVLLVVATPVAAWFAAPSLLRPRLEAALTRAAGRPVTVGGVRPAWDGGLELRLSRLAVANAPGGSRPEMLTIQGVTVEVDAAALLRGVVRIPQVRVTAPDLLLETDPAGRGNWERPAPLAPAESVATDDRLQPGGDASAPVELGRIVVQAGRVAFRDGRTGRQYEGELDVTVDPATPFGRSNVSAIGHVLIPERVDFLAKLGPGASGRMASLEAHGAGLDATASGVIDPTIRLPVGSVNLEATLAAASPLPARIGIPGLVGPARLHVALQRQGELVTLRDLRLGAPPGEIGGDLDIALSTPPSVRGTISSQLLDLTKLPRPAAPPPPVAPPAAPTSPAPPPSLPFALLDRANVDLHLAVAEWRDPRVTIRDLSGHLVIQDGRLVLDPFAGTGPGGRLTLAVRADGRATPPTLAVALRAPALALQPFVALAAVPGEVTGTAAIEADLQAAGATQADLVDSLAGRAAVTVGDGDIDLGVFGKVVAAARLPIDPKGRAHLRCLVVRADLAQGVANVSPLVIDATTLLVQGAGSVDLAHQTLALRLRPLLRTGPGIVVPMTLTGPWAKPKVDVDRGDLAGVLTSLTGQAADPCRAAGVASTVPLPAVKPLKPADLLKSLLR